MYRYGDGTPFPLDENFIETLTTAVETCTAAFEPLTEMDERRMKAKEGRRDGDREIAKLAELDKTITTALAPYLTSPDKKASSALAVAQKLSQTAKQALAQAKQHVDAKVAQLEGAALPSTAAAAILSALGPFFGAHQLPKTTWIMSWDVRGISPIANAVATSGKLTASFQLGVGQWSAPIRVDQLADGVVVHMMRKGLLGKAKPAPIDLGKYVVVAFERTASEQVVTLRENASKIAAGLRFAVTDDSATWVSISTAGDAEGESNPLDVEDVSGIRRLAEGANKALSPLSDQRTLVELALGGVSIGDLPEPKQVPFELLSQLTPLARSIRERSRMSGELVLKKDIGDNRREELYVPRSTLAQQFMGLPEEYRRPFEEMGISSEDTSPAIVISKPPQARASEKAIDRGEKNIEVDLDD